MDPEWNEDSDVVLSEEDDDEKEDDDETDDSYHSAESQPESGEVLSDKTVPVKDDKTSACETRSDSDSGRAAVSSDIVHTPPRNLPTDQLCEGRRLLTVGGNALDGRVFGKEDCDVQIPEDTFKENKGGDTSVLDTSIAPTPITVTGASHSNLNQNLAIGINYGSVVQSGEDLTSSSLQDETEELYAETIFIETGAYREVWNALQTKDHVFICGSPGSGKTTMAHYISGKYRAEGHRVICVDKLENFKYNTPTQTLLVCDNVFGTFASSADVVKNCDAMFEYLEHHFQLLEMEKDVMPLKVIMTSRTNVWNSVSQMVIKYQNSLLSPVINLTISTPLDDTEKEQILKKHLEGSQFDLTHDEMLAVARLEYTTLGFPYICQLFVKNSSSKRNAFDFFKKPWIYLHGIVADIFSKERYRAAVLLLMILNEGGLHLNDLLDPQRRRDSGLDKKISQIGEIMPDANNPSEIRKSARNEKDSLIVLLKNNCAKFSHPAIHDVVACIVIDLNPVVALENCSLKFIVDRIWISETKNTGISKDGHMNMFLINIEDDLTENLVSRLGREITNGNLSLSLSHQCFTFEDLVDKLFSYFPADNILFQRDKDRGFLFWSSYLDTGAFCKYIPRMQLCESDILECYLGCCMHGHLSYLKGLVGQSDSSFDKLATTTVGDILRTKDKTRPYLQSLSTGKSITAPAVPSDKDCPRESGDNRDMLIHVAAANGFTECVRILLDIVGTAIDVLGGNGMTALMHACYRGHTVLAQMLLDRRADPELLDEEKDNCLHLTCRGGCLDVAKLLLRQSMDLNQDGKYERTPLMYASYNGHEDIVKLLLENGAPTSVDSGSDTNSCLHLACMKGETNIVKILLDHGMNIEDVGSKFKRTPLMCACRHGKLETAKELKRRHAVLDAFDQENNSCLHLAAMKGHVPTAEWLLQTGATVNCVNSASRTPLMYAFQNGHIDMVTFLMNNGADIQMVDNSCLHRACMTGETNVVKILLDHGMNIEDVGSKFKRTPLMCACRHGKLETAKELKRRHAVLDIVDENNFSCLHLAAMKGHVPTAEWLLQSGIIVNCVNSASRTPLMYAFQNGHIDMVTFLRQNDADMQMVDDKKTTCLHFAAKSGDLHLVQLCLEFDHNIDPLTKDGWTPTMLACGQGHIGIVEQLVKKGADINLGSGCLFVACNNGLFDIVKFLTSSRGDKRANINKRGLKNATPLIRASYHGYANIVDHLLSCGADVLCKDDDGSTCLHTACDRGNEVVAEKLVGCFNVDELGASDHELIELIQRFSDMSTDN
ncbi:uncharacterized protein LOC124125735 [Haliotis rufescens]|uniref:uncharacterized protein LOC124125735 n=1 Tax=Haliotis rufescens TaxID=6454 RepID=UPI00201EB84D|nr:uncharacterized protein LOC124125735 [Haliotis rufescens]XP_046345065.2 uncharacterized protein LOC124125735 [Haliotis rufescens]